ncbi:MAG: hypothetical protein Ct9H300mP16_11600 [Pseudomonadota bacterium]|nr:MAG: hypothetical protein Ct9H300mP16_11600 [Pseudomonadota bacterium]
MSDSKEIQRTGDLAVEEAKPKLKRPQLYRVLLINDDYTPMEFVVIVCSASSGFPMTMRFRSCSMSIPADRVSVGGIRSRSRRLRFAK